MNLLQATTDPKLFKPWFRDEGTWTAWRAFLGALFGSSAKKTDMEYPVKKSNEEWRAVLSPGKSKSTHLPLQRWWQGSERAASPQLWWW